MPCEICGQTGGHSCHCPYYNSSVGAFRCEICGDSIQNGEAYIENDAGELAHYDCIGTVKQALQWLGYEIQFLEDSDS